LGTTGQRSDRRRRTCPSCPAVVAPRRAQHEPPRRPHPGRVTAAAAIRLGVSPKRVRQLVLGKRLSTEQRDWLTVVLLGSLEAERWQALQNHADAREMLGSGSKFGNVPRA